MTVRSCPSPHMALTKDNLKIELGYLGWEFESEFVNINFTMTKLPGRRARIYLNNNLTISEVLVESPHGNQRINMSGVVNAVQLASAINYTFIKNDKFEIFYDNFFDEKDTFRR